MLNALNSNHQIPGNSAEDKFFYQIISDGRNLFNINELIEAYFVLSPKEHYLIMIGRDRMIIASGDGTMHIQYETFKFERLLSSEKYAFEGRHYPIQMDRGVILGSNEVYANRQHATIDKLDPFRAGTHYEDYVGTSYTYAPEYGLNLVLLYLEKYAASNAKLHEFPIFIHDDGKPFNLLQMRKAIYWHPYGLPNEHYIEILGGYHNDDGSMYVFYNGEIILTPGYFLPDNSYFWECNRFSEKLRKHLRQIM